jgi:uncharacterized protein (DUF362 family)
MTPQKALHGISRRDFLRTAAAGIGALSLGAILEACEMVRPLPAASTTIPSPSSVQVTATSPSPSVTPPAAIKLLPTNTIAVETVPLPMTTNTPVIHPDLVVTHGGEPEELVRKAIGAIGGMQKFVSKGAKVIVKPNICVDHRTYEYAATTNPWVVGALVKLCFEAGAASVMVMDKPFYGTQKQAYEMSGIKEQVEASGGEMGYMLDYKYVPMDIPDAIVLKKTAIYDDILKADVLINVPVAKQHNSARLTLGMKNLMGVIWDRSILHSDLGQCIADLNTLIRPELTVIDAVRIMKSNGPTGGSLSYVDKLDTIIVSPDIVAADSYAASLFGLKPEGLAYIIAGTAMGLGHSDLENLKIEKIDLGT